MDKKINPNSARFKRGFSKYVGEIFLSARECLKGVACDAYTRYITEFEASSIETKFLEMAIRKALAKKKAKTEIQKQLQMDHFEPQFFCSVRSEDGEVWSCEIDQKGKILGKHQIGSEKTIFKSSTSEELFIDRFGVYEIFRHKSEKEAKIEGDYPAFVGYQDSQRSTGPVIVEILETFDYEYFKKELGDDESLDEIKAFPVYHIRYYVEQSLLDRLLTNLQYGTENSPGRTIQVAHINPFDDTPKCRKIRGILTSEFSQFRGKVRI